MKLSEAARLGIIRVRRPLWRDKNSYVKIDIIDGLMGPWLNVYDRKIQQFFNISTPQTILITDDLITDYEEYNGEIDSEDK